MKQDFALSSIKCILSLLSRNQSHKFKKKIFNFFTISLLTLWFQRTHESSAQRKRWHLIACDILLTYIKNKSSPKTELWGTPHDTNASWAKVFPKLIWKNLFEKKKKDLNQLTVYFEIEIIYRFSNSTLWSIVLKAFWRSLRITPLSNYFKTLSLK